MKVRVSALALLALLGGCATPRIGIAPRVGRLELKGQVDVGNGSGALRAHSTAGQLNLDDQTAFQPRLDFDWDKLHISLTTARVEYSARGTARASLRLGGMRASRKIPAHSDLEAGYVATEFTYDVPWIHCADIGLGFGLGTMAYDVTLAEKAIGIVSLSADDTLPFGYATLRMEKNFGPLRLLARLSGLALEPEHWELRFRDVDISAGLRLFGGDNATEGRLITGYRYITLDYAFDDKEVTIEVDAALVGPFVGFEVAF